MLKRRRIVTGAIVLLAASWSALVLADPPSHAPAHGWRAKHDPLYVGYTGREWERDFGVVSGHCDRQAIATVLGGVIGGVVGSKIGDDGNRNVATIIGAAVGALIGNRIGREMDAADRGCFGHTLEIGKPGVSIAWSNETTGVRYEMSPGAANHEFEGDCRDYRLQATAGDRVSVRKGVACQAEPGVWNVMRASRG